MKYRAPIECRPPVGSANSATSSAFIGPATSPTASLLIATLSSAQFSFTAIPGCAASNFSKIASATFGSVCVPRKVTFSVSPANSPR